MKTIKQKVVIFSSILFISGLVSLLVSQQVEAVTISQLNLELVARPGETIEQTVQLYDDSMSGITVYPAVYNFTADPDKEGSVLILTDPEDYNPDQEWLVFGTLPIATEAEEAAADEETAQEGEETLSDSERFKVVLPKEGTLADFPYHIVIPQNAEPGTHLISLVFQTKPQVQENQEGTAVYIGTNVATNIFLKVLGNTIDELSVDFRAGTYTNNDPALTTAERAKYFVEKKFFLKPPVDFLLKVSNTGNTHQKPDGNIKIYNDLFGSEPEKLSVNPENRIILPDTDRTFEAPSYGQGLMFGKYRAKLTLLYGNPLKPVEQEIVFWIVPLIEILIVLGAIILITITIIVIRKRQKGKKRKQDQQREEELRAKIVAEVKAQQAKSEPKAPEKKVQESASAAPPAAAAKKKNGKVKNQNGKAVETKQKAKS